MLVKLQGARTHLEKSGQGLPPSARFPQRPTTPQRILLTDFPPSPVLPHNSSLQLPVRMSAFPILLLAACSGQVRLRDGGSLFYPAWDTTPWRTLWPKEPLICSWFGGFHADRNKPSDLELLLHQMAAQIEAHHVSVLPQSRGAETLPGL